MLGPQLSTEKKVPSNTAQRLSCVCLCRHGPACEYQIFFEHGKVAGTTSNIFETVNGNEGLSRMVENIQRG